MTHVEKALQIMSETMNCAQAVLGAFSDELGLTKEDAMAVSYCFYSGMRKAEVCGACSGALMVLGLKYGRGKGPEVKSVINKVTEEFLDRFRALNGSYICKEILGYDISIPEEARSAREKGLFTTVCPKKVASAVTLLEQILSENE